MGGLSSLPHFASKEAGSPTLRRGAFIRLFAQQAFVWVLDISTGRRENRRGRADHRKEAL